MDNRLKLTIPVSEIEAGAWDQIKAALAIPFLSALAVMPDVHAGYDLPIGGVALLDGHIWPGAVGYDIGCGMVHANTGMMAEEYWWGHRGGRMTDLYLEVIQAVPVGFNTLAAPVEMAVPFPNASGDKEVNDRVVSKARTQEGTLGGGNHFIEVGVNAKGEVAVTIHSGSRNPGHTIGGHYMRLAKKHGVKAGNLAMFPLESELGQAYLADMKWAEGFALRNRREMLVKVLIAMGGLPPRATTADLWPIVNENHNHAEVQSDGTVLHRKGATPADKGQTGIIPANQRDGVFITEGLGNAEFLSSASHGAGRKMSRKKAKETIPLERFRKQMMGVMASTFERHLDEAPDAYKDIRGVLQAQDGILVNVIDQFKPLMVVKG